MRTCTSRKGEKPKRRPPVELNVAVAEDKALDHQNSSSPWPVEESEKTARFAFRGKEIVFVAF